MGKRDDEIDVILIGEVGLESIMQKMFVCMFCLII